MYPSPLQVQNPIVPYVQPPYARGNNRRVDPAWTLAQNDPRHPIIRELMDPLLKQCRGKWSLSRISEGANIAMKDLPQIPKYIINGRNTLCYRRVLDHCKSRKCPNKGGHEVDVLHVSDDFAKALSARIAHGVKYVISNPGVGWNAAGGEGGRKRDAPG